MNRKLITPLIVLAILLVLAGGTAGWFYRALDGSLAQLEGTCEVEGLRESVTIERDAAGVPVIRGENRLDVARALGFLHAQERFFQMDLLRRSAAGELSEVVGSAALDADRASRIHRFRHRAHERLAELKDDERSLLAAYSAGVNAGLDALDEKPFEYLILRADPAPWREEDSILALYAMYFVLNDATGRRDSDMGLLEDLLGPELASFLAPPGTEWDAPVDGQAFSTPPIPGTAPALEGAVAASNDGALADALEAASLAGSNNWAVAGSRTGHGRAIVANDMHLGMAVPNTWYRAMLVWPGHDGCGDEHRITGVTLPGAPMVVAGSNGRVAWGFTNSQGDWSDLVILEPDAEDENRYLTPDGWQTVEMVTETIAVRGAKTENLEIDETIWGPVVDTDHLGRRRAVKWIAHDPGAANLGLVGLEHVSIVEEAFAVANRTGIPPQNFVCADSSGNIGWTIIGRIPRRFGFSGRVPTSWAAGDRGWDGWLDSEQYPRIVSPPEGAIWTANARVVGGEMYSILGDGGYDLGARARQIRDDLLALQEPTERDMLAVQLDDRALFLDRWRSLLLALLDDEAIAADPTRAEFRRLVDENWTGRARIDSAGFRLVRAFRTFTFERVYGHLTAACEEADARFNIYRIQQAEGPLWRLVTERPPHLLAAESGSWRQFLLATIDATIDYYLSTRGGELASHVWGARNTLNMRHPLSGAIPLLSKWLDMPRIPLPGDSDMPRVQSPGWGASERFAVSPGHEEDGYFHMPAGQSGHPRSPFYSAGHNDWVVGRAAPFLPGPPAYRLELRPPGR